MDSVYTSNIIRFVVCNIPLPDRIQTTFTLPCRVTTITILIQ
nr:MAG TPA: hypothetical protein [Caudoviricetes sp.]